MNKKFAFNRMELAGSMGDLGTILPLALGMILVNGLSAAGLFFSIGLFYILTGLFFGITMPVQPMKVIGAYAIATMMTTQQVMASSLLMSAVLLFIGLTGAINLIGEYTPKFVIRGVQFSTGVLLMNQGFKMIMGNSKIQMLHGVAEPHLALQSLGPIPIGIVIGIAGTILTILLLDNRKIPAGLVIIISGFLTGLIFGNHKAFSSIKLGLYFPEWLPFGFPSKLDFMFVIFALVLPQIPITIGNAVIANKNLSDTYFKENSSKVTYKSLCVSMALGNLVSFSVGGMPQCHGAGGLSAHYRFGARTAGSNLIIGFIFIVLVVVLGNGIYGFLTMIPMAILGVLLLFSGSQLAMTFLDINKRKDLFVVLMMLGITLSSNLAIGFGVGIFLAGMFKTNHFKV